MKKGIILYFALLMVNLSYAQGEHEDPGFATSEHLKITKTSVVFDQALEQLIFSIEVKGNAGASLPSAFGQLDGAPVLGYVFPTTLVSSDVGFSDTEGIVALALTSHPDFDDTPLWDENNDKDYANDGIIWHSHWVMLTKDSRVKGGLSVKQFNPNDEQVTLPPTNPGMPMYMDSPGFSVINKGNTIRVIVPTSRVDDQVNFKFDAVTAYMQVNVSMSDYPMLGVYAVYSVASGDLSLPYQVQRIK